nr:primosomal protein N' [Ideonella livida]
MPFHGALDSTLSYLGPALPPGSLVRAPLGHREVLGLVWDAPSDDLVAPGQTLRALLGTLDPLPPLPLAWRRLVRFAASYYQRSLGEMALSVLPPELRKLDPASLTRRLRRKGGLGSAPAPTDAPQTAARPEPTEDQAQALAQLAALQAREPGGTALLLGVTGSGKTEVYLRRAEEALAQGRQVLVLVPEINLTPQLEARLRDRFPGRLLVTQHSGLTPAQRLRHWLAAHLGQADLVLGTRMAVFSPLPRLGLIVVDEEHDASYKQQEGARYSARDLAVYRGRLEGVPVLLGSATPSLESWRHAQQGRYALVPMRQRVGQGALPQVRLVDMTQQPQAPRGQEPPPLAAPVLAALRERLERGEQSLLFLNRRGFAPVLHCPACQWKSDCPHCSAWRVFHKLDRTLRCHHCGFSDRVPRACPSCGNPDIQPVGRGTERLEEQIGQWLPGVRVARIDADSTRLKGTLEQQLSAVHAGEVDILVGTQMVTKGHDFRRITLVVAVNPDGALFTTDFRGPERLFATLMQAGGRAGRDAEAAARSELWIQTWNPAHALFQSLRRHDYESFAAAQLAEREMAGLPPYSHLALLRVEARTPEAAQDFLALARRDAMAWVEAQAAEVTVYPPVPPYLARVAGLERRQMLLESGSRPALQALLRDWLPGLRGLRAQTPGVARWALDVDPLGI